MTTPTLTDGHGDPGLTDCPLGRHCAAAALCPSASIAVQRPMPRGARVPGGGLSETGQVRLFVVRSGLVAASATLPDGRRQLTGLMTPGEAVCAAENTANGLWAEALTRTVLCRLDLQAGTGSAAIFALCHGALSRSVAHMVRLGRFSGAERVAAFLADLARRTGRAGEGGWQLSLPLSRDDIADHLGLNAETVSRILGRLRREGLVRFSTPTACVIPDLGALEAQVPFAMDRPTRRKATRPGQAADGPRCTR